MHRLSFSSTDSDTRRTRRNRICIGVGVGLVCIVILTAGLVIGLKKKDDNSSSSDRPICAPLIDDVQKYDCHPDRPISQKACLDRGCCFISASDLQVDDFDLINSSYLGVPSCFYPHNYRGYMVEQATWKGNAVTANLKRTKPSGFPKDVQNVYMEVIPIDDYKLRIRIKDPKSNRYEPEVPKVEFSVKADPDEKYSVNFTTNGLLQIIRKIEERVLFETDLSRLIFSDQFLQLSTKISSNNIYGLGEQKEGIRKSTNFTRYTLFNQGDLPVPHRNLYGSHPFYLVMEPDGKANGLFLLNTNAIDYVLQDRPAVTIRAVGGILDFFLFLGPSPADVVSQYTNLFGRPNFPPRWSLGFHICKYGYFTLDKTKEVLQRNLDEGIPIDVQWHDIDYMQRHLDFTYDPVKFEGLPEFVDELHENGRHYVAMISPGVSNTEEPGNYTAYDVGKELDLFIKDPSGKKYIEGEVWNTKYTVFPDFSNAATENYWKDRFAEFHSILDFDGVWIDMNEPLNFKNGSIDGCPATSYDDPPYVPGRPYPLKTLTLCMSAKHNKTLHYYEHNLEAYREAKATHRAMKEITKKRPFIISRASFSGQGVYSGHWSGDITSNWDDLRYTIPAMLAFSLYGMPMTGSDICGFRLNVTEELCARWQSLGAFYPFSRNHNDFDTFEQDPAAMGPTVVASAKKALHTRYYLLPYLYTLFYRNHINGETVARPLFFEFPLDNKTYTIEDEFLWGQALLIMPALEPGISSINPYIPEGLWYDFPSGKPRKSTGERFTLDAEITDINLAIRGGYILPAQKPGNTTVDSAKSPFDFLIALNSEKKAIGELFWDDGESLDTYDEGKYTLIKLNVDNNYFTTTVVKNGAGIDMQLGFIKVYGLDSAPNQTYIGETEVDFRFEENELRINGTSFSLLNNLVVKWN